MASLVNLESPVKQALDILNDNKDQNLIEKLKNLHGICINLINSGQVTELRFNLPDDETLTDSCVYQSMRNKVCKVIAKAAAKEGEIALAIEIAKKVLREGDGPCPILISDSASSGIFASSYPSGVQYSLILRDISAIQLQNQEILEAEKTAESIPEKLTRESALRAIHEAQTKKDECGSC